MDRKFMRKLLALSCCGNVIMCLLIVYSHGTLTPTLNINSAASDVIWRSQLNNQHPPKSMTSNDKRLETGAEAKNINSTFRITQQTKDNDNKLSLIKLQDLGSNHSSFYDPSFGFYHIERELPPRDVKELFHRVVPNMVYYVWCGRGRTFLYKHFISIYTMWYQMEPDVIEIQYEFTPLEDKYNTWLSWLRLNIPSLTLQPLPPHVTGNRCGANFGLEILADRGGLFLENGVTLGSTSQNRIHTTLDSIRSFSFFQDGSLAWAAASAGDSMIKHYLGLSEELKKSHNISEHFGMHNEEINDNNTIIVNIGTCSKQDPQTHNVSPNLSQDMHSNSIEDLLIHSSQNKGIFCYDYKDTTHPIDITQSAPGSIERTILPLLYNIDNIINNSKKDITGVNNKSKKESTIKSSPTHFPIPNIVHYIWFGQKNMTLSMYLSLLSSVHIVQPETILIHSDLKLYGPYWELTLKHSMVRLVYREIPRYIYHHRILYTQHTSDIVRADILNKYGGLYLDWDALWLKSPKDLLESKSYDVILSRDHMPRQPFPDTINMGVALAKPRSKFIKAWRAAWVHYKTNDFLYNAVELPYKIYELFPHSTLLHDRLQVMCYYLMCHPLFHPDHKHWGKPQPFDWTRDVYSIHFTHPDPPAFQNETALFSGQGMFADIGRHIWNLDGQNYK